MILTDEQVRRIERRAKAATRGPWYFFRGAGPTLQVSRTRDHKKAVVHWMGFESADTAKFKRDWNAYFIAHSREDVPNLIATIRALQEENERLREQINLAIVDAGIAEAEANELRDRLASTVKEKA